MMSRDFLIERLISLKFTDGVGLWNIGFKRTWIRNAHSTDTRSSQRLAEDKEDAFIVYHADDGLQVSLWISACRVVAQPWRLIGYKDVGITRPTQPSAFPIALSYGRFSEVRV